MLISILTRHISATMRDRVLDAWYQLTSDHHLYRKLCYIASSVV